MTIVVTVDDGAGHAVSGASVGSTWHYKTTTSSEAGTTDGGGHAYLTRSISSAADGYTVLVDVAATLGQASGTARTSFTPRTC